MLMFSIFFYLILLYKTGCVKPQSIYQNVDTCTYHYASTGQLEVLDKIVEIKGKENFTDLHILLSLCHAPLNICGSAKACIINRKHPGKIKNAGLYYKFDEGNNMLRSVGGQSCSNNKNFTVFIKFHCTQDTSSQPIILNKTECELHISMMMLGCQVDCLNFVNKQAVDLRVLKNKIYRINDTSTNVNRSFALSICETPSPCEADVFICEITNRSSISIANIKTQNFDYEADKYSLIIKGSFKHPHNKRQSKKTEISLTCNWNVKDISNLKYVKLSSSSKIYKFLGESSAACVKLPMDCIVKGPKEYLIYNLTTLNNSTGWKVNHTNVGEIYLNICGPLLLNYLETSGDCLEQYSQICYKDGTGRFLNLGSISGNFAISPDETIKIKFVGGSTCNENIQKTYSTEIELICNSVENGPVLVETSNCVYKIMWKTPAACSQQFAAGDECLLSDVTGNFDLNSLKTESDRQHKINETSFILFNICTSLKSECNNETNVGVCYIKDDHQHVVGYWSSTLIRNNRTLSLHMKGDKCNQYIDKERTATIYFHCNESVSTEDVQITVTKDGCDISIHIYSSKACVPASFSSCKKSKQNTVYDLSPLTRNDTNYEVSDGSNIIVINVCRSVVNTGDLLCPQNAAVCKMKISNFNIHHRYESVGTIDSGDTLSYKDGYIIMHYYGGYCSLGVHWSIKIIFQCSEEEGQPEIVNKTDCSYDFLWKTKHACGKEMIEENINNNKNCSYLHSESGRSIDFNGTVTNYELNITHHDVSYFFNICDNNYTCCIDKGTKCTGYHSNIQLLKNEDIYYLQYGLEKQCISKNAETNKLRIYLKCNHNSKNEFDDNVYVEGSTFSINLYTRSACSPQVFLNNAAPQLRSSLNVNVIPLNSTTDKIKTVQDKISVDKYAISSDTDVINQTRTKQRECKKENPEKLINFIDLPGFSITSHSNVLYTINRPSSICNGYICKNKQLIVPNKFDCPEVQVDDTDFSIKLVYNSDVNNCDTFHTEIRIKCNSSNSQQSILLEDDCTIIIEYPDQKACELFSHSIKDSLDNSDHSNNITNVAIFSSLGILILVGTLIMGQFILKRKKRLCYQRISHDEAVYYRKNM